MANLISLLLSPILFLVSIPLTIFAIFTTTFAFSTLILHVIIVYAELAAVLVRNQFVDSAESPKSYHESRRSSPASGHPHTGSMTSKVPESSGLGIFGSGGMERDFEGVGGWRVPGSDDDDVLWTSMNSRLELPAIVDERKRHHQRSLTSGSISSRPLITRSSMRSLMRTSASLHTTDDVGPEEYFPVRVNPRSATAVDSTSTRRSSLCRKNSSTSTFSSDGSVRTIQMKSHQI